MGHVFARLSGYGWTLLPFAPYRIARTSGPGAIRVEYDGRQPPSGCTIHFSAGAHRIELDLGTRAVAEVCELSPSSKQDDIVIETSQFSSTWPAGFELVADGAPGPIPFDLVGPHGSLIFVQGPYAAARVGDITQRRRPDQQLAGSGEHVRGEWVEFEYDHEGQRHVQRLSTVDWPGDRVLVVTAQAPFGVALQAHRAVQQLIQSLGPPP